MTPEGTRLHRAATKPIHERTFHRWLRETLPAGKAGGLPLGDDAAALRPPKGQVAILSTDALVEGFHFVRRSPPRAIGRAATAVSLSDAASKGARPVGILLDILIPSSTPQSWLQEVVLGAEAEAAQFGAHVVGGDTKPSPVRTVVGTVVAWGDPKKTPARSGARPGDQLVVTGTVGRGGAAWAQYRSEPRAATSLRELLDVRPRVREGLYLAKLAHAMLDTSDGLADAARLMSEASGVRLEIDEGSIPWFRGRASDAREAANIPRATAFFGGDYELLAAIPARSVARLRRVPGAGATVIGKVRRGAGAFLIGPNGTIPLPPAGWQPFDRPGA